MPRYPRPSTPHPTQPPPLPPEPPQGDEPVETAAKQLEPWKVFVGIAMALVGAGAAFAGWNADVVKQRQLDEVKTGAATALSASQANTSTQLGALQSQVQDLRTRQSAVEGKLDILIGLSTHMVDQATEIARATHARQLPSPVATDP